MVGLFGNAAGLPQWFSQNDWLRWRQFWVNIDTLAERANSAYLGSISDIRTPYIPRRLLCANLPILRDPFSDNWIGCSQVPAEACSRRGDRRNPVPSGGLGIV
jgi:hypothetical protein